MDFGEALCCLRSGKRVYRAGWNGKRMWIRLSTPLNVKLEGSVEQYKFLPFIEMKTVHNELVPWLASQTDVLAHDWEEVG